MVVVFVSVFFVCSRFLKAFVFIFHGMIILGCSHTQSREEEMRWKIRSLLGVTKVRDKYFLRRCLQLNR